MTDQQTELNELYEAMVECGIWPEDILYGRDESDGQLTICVGMRWSGVNGSSGVLVIDGKYALFTARGVAEEWLENETDCCGPSQNIWGEKGHYWWQYDTGMVHTEHSLPAAIRYAHKQEKGGE